MVSIPEPFVVSLNESLNLLTMKKIIKTKVSNASITSNVSIASRQFFCFSLVFFTNERGTAVGTPARSKGILR
jgi:hypothetical protein